MLHHNLINKLSNLLLKGVFDLIGAPLVNDGLDRRPGNVIHVLHTHCLIRLIELKRELEDGLVLGHVSFEWDLLEDGVDHGRIIVRLLGKRHVLELHDSAGGSDDVVLGVGLTGVLMELAQHCQSVLQVRLEQDWRVLSQDTDVVGDVPVDFAVFGIAILLKKGQVVVEVLWDDALAVGKDF